ncbi:MAG TPA: hypothetical protein VGM84_07335 [Steroidobacteraceae bacterium]|jgi:hypothetical protein
MPAPEDEYTQRLQAREGRAGQLRQLQERIGSARLIMVVVIVATIWYLHGQRGVSSAWLFIPVAAFVALVVWHMRARREHSKAQRAVDFYRRGLGRLRDKWAGTGQQGKDFTDPHHVYSGDLDLFGEGSLFELLCAARTRMGEETLARWLLSPATVQEVRGRQAAVEELRSRVALREELATLGEDASVGVYPGGLLKWAATPNGLVAGWIRWVAIVLPPLAVATALLWWLRGLASPFIAVVLIEAGILAALGKQINQVINGTENSFDGLNLFAQMLLRVEHEPSQAPVLRALGERLRSHSLPPSRTMGQLATIANLAGSRRNQILATLAVPLMYTLWVALAAERWRARHHTVVQSWADVVGEFEALVSLAGHGYEHPDDPFPEFVDLPSGSFVGVALGHPLIPAARCVRNDVAIEGTTRGLLISGSNMSGKSTLMRTVGINTVLAMAGAPVRASRLTLTALQVGASIRVNDSLQEGSSRFYAEIKRLRQLLDLAERRDGFPLLFLLDELLQGTNSHDRRIGAEGIVRGFLKRGAIGLITTHDLAITDIAGLEAGALHNVHFQDDLVDARMTFDFTLRDGIVTKSNGVELMRSLGLEV